MGKEHYWTLNVKGQVGPILKLKKQKKHQTIYPGIVLIGQDTESDSVLLCRIDLNYLCKKLHLFAHNLIQWIEFLIFSKRFCLDHLHNHDVNVHSGSRNV